MRAAGLQERWPQGSVWSLAVVSGVSLLYLLFLGTLKNFPFSDLPNQLARATIMGDLLFNAGAEYGAQFRLTPAFVPYIGGDLVLAVLTRIFGPEGGGRVWVLATFLSMPAAVWYLLASVRLGHRAWAVATLLSLYFATDWFFVSGMFNYRWALALAIAAYGAFRRYQGSPGVARYALYCLLVVLGYLVHLSAPVLLGTMLAGACAMQLLRRRLAIRVALAGMAPVVAVLAINMVTMQPRALGDVFRWRGPVAKLLAAGSSGLRFHAPWESLLFLLVAACLIVVWRQSRGSGRGELADEACGVVAALLVLFAILPVEAGSAYDVDSRAIPALEALLMIAVVARIDARPANRPAAAALALASCAALANLAYLQVEVGPQDARLGDYRRVLDTLPAGARFLGINTRPALGRYQPFSHAESLGVLHHQPATANLFGAHNVSFISYFSFRDVPPYAPPVYWALHGSREVNWAAMRADYDFLLVTRPFDHSLVPIAYSTSSENAVAALLKVEK